LSALAAIAVFPILTLLLIGLSRAENVFTGDASRSVDRSPVEAPTLGEVTVD
jgi:hypothetical protein